MQESSLTERDILIECLSALHKAQTCISKFQFPRDRAMIDAAIANAEAWIKDGRGITDDRTRAAEILSELSGVSSGVILLGPAHAAYAYRLAQRQACLSPIGRVRLDKAYTTLLRNPSVGMPPSQVPDGAD